LSASPTARLSSRATVRAGCSRSGEQIASTFPSEGVDLLLCALHPEPCGVYAALKFDHLRLGCLKFLAPLTGQLVVLQGVRGSYGAVSLVDLDLRRAQTHTGVTGLYSLMGHVMPQPVGFGVG
jgi:hypothetical protein